jgi:hypothetical protein
MLKCLGNYCVDVDVVRRRRRYILPIYICCTDPSLARRARTREQAFAKFAHTPLRTVSKTPSTIGRVISISMPGV